MAKNLKAYLRYTGDGRIVPGGNISSRQAPRVGRWQETPINPCCIPASHNICISGFTTFTNLNGTYEYIGKADDRAHYQKSGPYDVYWNTDRWWIGEWAYAIEDVQFPYLVTTWSIHPLEAGSISISEGDCSSSPVPTPPSPESCVTYRYILVRGTSILSYTDCEGNPSEEMSLSAPVDMTFCAEYDSVILDGDGELVLVSEECTTTTTTSSTTSTTTSSTTSTTSSTTTTTTTVEPG